MSTDVLISIARTYGITVENLSRGELESKISTKISELVGEDAEGVLNSEDILHIMQDVSEESPEDMSCFGVAYSTTTKYCVETCPLRDSCKQVCDTRPALSQVEEELATISDEIDTMTSLDLEGDKSGDSEIFKTPELSEVADTTVPVTLPESTYMFVGGELNSYVESYDEEDNEPYMWVVYKYLLANPKFTLSDMIAVAVASGKPFEEDDREYLQQILDYWISEGDVMEWSEKYGV